MIDAKGHVGETRLRSIVKGVAWRVLATLTTMILVLVFTGKLVLSLEIGALEVIVKLLLYYTHERVCNLVNWDRFSVYYGKLTI